MSVKEDLINGCVCLSDSACHEERLCIYMASNLGPVSSGARQQQYLLNQLSVGGSKLGIGCLQLSHPLTSGLDSLHSQSALAMLM